MLKQPKIVRQKHAKDVAPEDAESLRIKIYAEALANLTKQKERRSLFQLKGRCARYSLIQHRNSCSRVHLSVLASVATEAIVEQALMISEARLK